MARLIDGARLAEQVRAAVASETASLRAMGVAAGLAVVLVGENPASQIYVRSKVRQCKAVGIASYEHRLPATTTEDELIALVDRLNGDKAIDGILVQLPLPPHIDSDRVLDAIDPLKDVDGFHPVNVGRLSIGSGGLIPCTPLGCMMLLDTVIESYRGMKAVVIGKSNIVGKPVAMLLLERECTVTVTHIATRNLPQIVRTADILVAAAGSPGLVRGDWIRPGAVVIDVGITRVATPEGSWIVGDVAYDEVGHAGAVTPVPGGVGPMTIACLLQNTVKAARLRRGLPRAAALIASMPAPREAADATTMGVAMSD